MKSIGYATICTIFVACSSSSPQHVGPIKTITIQYNPTGAKIAAIEAAKAIFATQGAIEAQLPVKVKVLDPSTNVDRSKACEIRFAGFMDMITLDSGYGNRGVSYRNGPSMYPCRVLLLDSMRDIDEIRLILEHELGHIILDQSEHNRDPSSIMSNDVQLPGRYRFTESDTKGLVGD